MSAEPDLAGEAEALLRRLRTIQSECGAEAALGRVDAALARLPRLASEADLCDELRDLIDSIPCLVARPGETTYECRVESPCAACDVRDRLRAAVRGLVAAGRAAERADVGAWLRSFQRDAWATHLEERGEHVGAAGRRGG